MKRKKRRKINVRIAALILAFAVLIGAVIILNSYSNGGGNEKASKASKVSSDKSSPKTSKSDIKPDAPNASEKKEEEPYVKVESIALSKHEVNVTVGSKIMPIVTVSPSNATNKGEIWSSSDNKIAVVDSIGNIKGVSEGECTVTVRSADNAEAFADVKVKVNPYIPPIEPELTYINGILIANKTYALPSTYNPGVDPNAQAALELMFADAKNEGLNLFVKSGFRSYNTQKSLYNSYVKRDGQAAADRYSARPGHSEHQTGLGFDINKANSTFEGTPEALWLAANCYKYGFIIRYPKGKESITGYIYEPWHVRYLGVDTATAVYESGLCLEEYLGITSAYQ